MSRPVYSVNILANNLVYGDGPLSIPLPAGDDLDTIVFRDIIVYYESSEDGDFAKLEYTEGAGLLNSPQVGTIFYSPFYWQWTGRIVFQYAVYELEPLQWTCLQGSYSIRMDGYHLTNA